MRLEVRAATAAEQAAIDAWLPYELTVPASRDPAAAARHLRQWRSLPATQRIPPGLRRRDLVADADGRPVGFLTLLLGGRDSLSGEPAAYVADLQVDPAWRRRGVGRRLLTAALTEARGAGCALLLLDVAAGNAAALRLYRSLGFACESLRLGLRLDGRTTGGGTVVLEA